MPTPRFKPHPHPTVMTLKVKIQGYRRGRHTALTPGREADLRDGACPNTTAASGMNSRDVSKRLNRYLALVRLSYAALQVRRAVTSRRIGWIRPSSCLEAKTEDEIVRRVVLKEQLTEPWYVHTFNLSRANY